MEAPNHLNTNVPAEASYLVEQETVPQKSARRRNPLSRVEASKRLMTDVLAKASYLVYHETIPQKPA